MTEALAEARKAAAADEIPVGAVLVLDQRVVARAHNLTEKSQSPLAHAELLCLQEAAAELGAWRLMGACLYTTLEPCPMCAGAILQARLKSLVYGARSSRLGADGSWIALLPGSSSNGQSAKCHPFHLDLEVHGGILASQSAVLLKDFFKARRRRPLTRPCALHAMDISSIR
ncbi:hypothetical protein WJX74_001682 [Apatococcus lobatus]|uniref:tRNA(adenine(34)) deaminase n=1 Tax=Apatococcus lobatus TaxID=904363 RepID=A0AAW1Q2R3_9CHLO